MTKAVGDDETIRMIVGMSRAGTSSMVNALNLRGDTIAFGETGFWGVPKMIDNTPLPRKGLERLRQIYSGVGMTSLKTGEAGLDTDEVRITISNAIATQNNNRKPSDVFRAIGASMARLSGRQYWVEKTPFHMMYADKVIEFYKDVRIIVCIRNPEGFLKSYKHQGDRKRETVRKNFQSLYHPAIASFICSRYYKKAVELQSKFPEQILVLRLEDTIKSPKATMRLVGQHLKLPKAETYEYPKSNSSFTPNNITQSLAPIDMFWLRLFMKSTSKRLDYNTSESRVSMVTILGSVFHLIVWPFKNLRLLQSQSRNILSLFKRWFS